MFSCNYPDCDKSYKNKTHLFRHIRIIHEKTETYPKRKPVFCPFKNCGKSFLRKEQLENHIKKVHEKNDDSFVCDSETFKKMVSTMKFLGERVKFLEEKINRLENQKN